LDQTAHPRHSRILEPTVNGATKAKGRNKRHREGERGMGDMEMKVRKKGRRKGRKQEQK
jgi:hypothetical protein